MFHKRRQLLIDQLNDGNFGGVLIDSPSNLYYYTGFTGGEGLFFLSVEGEGFMITDSRYFEQVEKECPDITLVPWKTKGMSEHVKELFLQCNISNACPIAIEETMNLSLYLKLCEVCKEYSFHVAKDLIYESRLVKDENELENLRQAEAIGDAAFSHILGIIKPGMTEMEIALELEFFMKKQGASKLSFDTIVASGPNSSMPHAQVTNRRIEQGDFVTMDFGCVNNRYCSDMTRTIAIGYATEEMKKIYEIVLDANKRAMEQVREGVSCKWIDSLARDYITECGYGTYFGHGLGHGVGLEIHEEPRFSPKCEVITKENMVITDEPGIYLPGKFGVRIEDLLVVKKDGCEVLSHSTKDLIIV